MAYYESPWMHEEWTAGAYATSFDPGSLIGHGRLLRENVGPLSFAGSDVAGRGFQHVDGAVRMGEAAADGMLVVDSAAVLPSGPPGDECRVRP